MQSEVSQKEKDSYPILTHMCTCMCVCVCVCLLEKNDTEKPICKARMWMQT